MQLSSFEMGHVSRNEECSPLIPRSRVYNSKGLALTALERNQEDSVNALARKLSSTGLRSVLATALLVGTASATTYVVDANGGFDFTDIPPAIAAASPGDVILVHPGSYSGFTLNIGLSIVGTAGVQTRGITVSVASGPRVALSSFHCLSLSVTSCAVPVIANDLTMDMPGTLASGYAVDVQSSSDVRLRGLHVPEHLAGGVGGLRALHSRVEITGSSVFGGKGDDSQTGYDNAKPGGIGVLCDQESDVHISLSTIYAGPGGVCFSDQFPAGSGGTGGVGILVQGSSKLLLSDAWIHFVSGGDAGLGIDCGHDGYPAPGVSVISGSYARSSHVLIYAGAPGCILHMQAPTSGSIDFVSPIDPSLELAGTTAPDRELTLVIHGTPHDAAQIRLGRQAVVHDEVGIYEDELTNAGRIYDLGTLPASGEATMHLTVPDSLPHGYLMVFQGSTVGSDGATRLTQSAPVVVH
jgi:hypothetical protein